MSKYYAFYLAISVGMALSGCVKAQVEDVTGGIWEYRPEGDHKDVTKSLKYISPKKVSLTDKLDLYATTGFDGDVAFVAKCTDRDKNKQCQNVSIALMDKNGKLLNDFGEYYYPELVTYNQYPAFLINVAPDGIYRLYPVQQNVITMEEAGSKSVVFADDRFLIEKDGLLGFIGRDGKIAIEPRYIAAQTFVDGHALAIDQDGVMGMLAPDGSFYPETFACMTPLNDTSYLVNSGGVLMDFTKDIRINPNAIYMAGGYQPPESGYFCANGHWGVIDENYNILIPAEYKAVQLGLYYHIVMNDRGIHALLNMQGERITEFDYDEVSFLTDEKGYIKSRYAVVRRFSKWGVVASDGSIAIPFEHEELGPESEGYIAFRRDQQWGFLDTEGNEVFAPLFSGVKPFSGGRAEATLEGKTTYVYRDESARKAWIERDRVMKQQQ